MTISLGISFKHLWSRAAMKCGVQVWADLARLAGRDWGEAGAGPEVDQGGLAALPEVDGDLPGGGGDRQDQAGGAGCRGHHSGALRDRNNNSLVPAWCLCRENLFCSQSWNGRTTEWPTLSHC